MTGAHKPRGGPAKLVSLISGNLQQVDYLPCNSGLQPALTYLRPSQQRVGDLVLSQSQSRLHRPMISPARPEGARARATAQVPAFCALCSSLSLFPSANGAFSKDLWKNGSWVCAMNQGAVTRPSPSLYLNHVTPCHYLQFYSSCQVRVSMITEGIELAALFILVLASTPETGNVISSSYCS